MRKVKVATTWLDGCSGCHMSLLDLDAALIPIARKVEMVYGPLVDAQEFPEEVDVTFIEGAVSTSEDVEKVQQIRQSTKVPGRARRLRCDRQRFSPAEHCAGQDSAAIGVR